MNFARSDLVLLQILNLFGFVRTKDFTAIPVVNS